ncbi:MAG: hypothetical protein ACXVXY_04990 [Mycobacteriaceae bacterium]|jgi:hypothetical protein
MSETAEEAVVRAPRRDVSAVNKFAAAHGEGAQAVVEYVSTSAVRVCLVATDGTMGDVVVRDLATAKAVIEASVAQLAEEWDRELVNTVKLPAGHNKKMAGYLARR